MLLRRVCRLTGHVLLTLVCLSFPALATALSAEQVVPAIGGEAFTSIAIVTGDPEVTTIRYVRPTEDHKLWTKLVAYTNYRNDDIGDAPKVVATRLVKGLQHINPGAQYKLSGNPEGTTLMLDFLSWSRSQEYLEMNVYRIESAGPGNGVYTVQFIVRMPYFRDVTEEVTTAIQQLRAGLIQQMAKYNMKDVKQLLNDQRERNLGKTQ